MPRRLVEGAFKTGTVCALESELVLEPSRLFAIYRFADGRSLVQEVIALGSRVMAEAKLLDPAVG